MIEQRELGKLKLEKDALTKKREELESSLETLSKKKQKLLIHWRQPREAKTRRGNT